MAISIVRKQYSFVGNTLFRSSVSSSSRIWCARSNRLAPHWPTGDRVKPKIRTIILTCSHKSKIVCYSPFLQLLLLLLVANENEENENTVEGIAEICHEEYLLRYLPQLPFDRPGYHLHRPVHSHGQKQFQIQVESMKIMDFQFPSATKKRTNVKISWWFCF